MKISKSKIEKIKRKITEQLTKDSFFSFCFKENPEKYDQEFQFRLTKEINQIKETLEGRKESKKFLQFKLVEDEFSHIKDSWQRKFYTNKKINDIKKKNKNNGY